VATECNIIAIEEKGQVFSVRKLLQSL